jgi:lipopolysaccharide export system permease protein
MNKLYFYYISRHYLKNLLSILFGLSFAFASIDYFQNVQNLSISGSYKILYIYYMWQEALGLLYPLVIVFALIMTKMSFVRNNTMSAFHAFGYSKKVLFRPFLFISFLLYALFTYLHTTEFSYAKDKAKLIVENNIGTYDVNNLFFKYNDSFVYIHKLDPINQEILDMTIFKLEGYQVRSTIKTPKATFDGHEWHAQELVIKKNIYKNNKLIRYEEEHKKHLKTLKGYKPKVIESLYEGKAVTIIDIYNTWRVLEKQNLNSDKIRAIFYAKVVVPLFAIALLLILFFKLPFHARMMNVGRVVALSLGVTFMIWGILFGLNQIGTNGLLPPEITGIVPIVILWIYALFVYFVDEKL